MDYQTIAHPTAYSAQQTAAAAHVPGRELGAMPPFGNLYGMEVFVTEALSKDDEIAFNAGSHTELIKMRYVDFARLVHPFVV